MRLLTCWPETELNSRQWHSLNSQQWLQHNSWSTCWAHKYLIHTFHNMFFNDTTWPCDCIYCTVKPSVKLRSVMWNGAVFFRTKWVGGDSATLENQPAAENCGGRRRQQPFLLSTTTVGQVNPASNYCNSSLCTLPVCATATLHRMEKKKRQMWGNNLLQSTICFAECLNLKLMLSKGNKHSVLFLYDPSSANIDEL